MNERAEIAAKEPKEVQEKLVRQLNLIAERGLASSVNELVAGVASVSSAIYDSSHNTLYALGLSLPESQMNQEVIERLSANLYHKASYPGCMVGDPYWLQRSINP